MSAELRSKPGREIQLKSFYEQRLHFGNKNVNNIFDKDRN